LQAGREPGNSLNQAARWSKHQEPGQVYPAALCQVGITGNGHTAIAVAHHLLQAPQIQAE